MIKDVIKKIDEIATSDPDRIAYDYLGQTNTYGDWIFQIKLQS